MNNPQNNCFICLSELIYTSVQKKANCHYCKKEFVTEVQCKKGHFVCDDCHSMDGNRVILVTTINNKGTDPFELAIEIMKNPAIKMHGPEHHFLVPAVLLSTYLNLRKKKHLKEELIKKAYTRAKKVPGGFCGTHGSCGAGLGLGIFFSIIKETTPLSVESWAEIHEITAKALLEIGRSGGPRCCKRDTFIALNLAIHEAQNTYHKYLDRHKEVQCNFSKNNKQCLKMKCKFFKKDKDRYSQIKY